MKKSLCGDADCPTPYEFCEACVRADEREKIARDIEARADLWGDPHRHFCIPDLAAIARGGAR